MESDLELSMASKAVVRCSQEELKRIEELVRSWDEIAREKKAGDEFIKRDDGDAKMEDYSAEEMNIMAKEKMLPRRRERLMRHFRRRQTAKKNSKSQDSEMKMAQEEVKRLMEKAIREARDEVINAAKIEDSKAEEMNIADEKTFPRRRGRLIRYLRRQRSKSQDSDFQIKFQQPMAEESFSDDSDE